MKLLNTIFKMLKNGMMILLDKKVVNISVLSRILNMI